MSCAQNPAEIDEWRSIQVQSQDSSPTDRCEPYDQEAVIAPRKMSQPIFFSRMEQWHGFPGGWVDGRCLVTLVSVTSGAGEGEIV